MYKVPPTNKLPYLEREILAVVKNPLRFANYVQLLVREIQNMYEELANGVNNNASIAKISRLATGTVDLQNGDAKTTVYTVPVSKSGIVTQVVIRNPTESLAGGTDFDIGDGAGADTWVTAVNLSTLTASTDCIIIPAPTAKFTVFDAGDTFGIIPVTGATADAQATMDVFGYEV